MLSHKVIPESRNLSFPFISCNIFLSTTNFTHFPLSAGFQTKERLPLLSADPLIWFLSVSFMGVFQYFLPDTSLWLFTLSPSTDRNLFYHSFWNIYSLKTLSQSSLFLQLNTLENSASTKTTMEKRHWIAKPQTLKHTLKEKLLLINNICIFHVFSTVTI